MGALVVEPGHWLHALPVQSLDMMPEDSIHAEVLRDNIADAQEHPSYGNWAGGIIKKYRRLGMASPFSSSGITCLDSLGFRANMKGQLCKVWDGLQKSPVSCTLCLTLSFQCPFPGYSCSCSSAWGLMLCLWNRAGLLGLPFSNISAAALCARPGHWGMKGILF